MEYKTSELYHHGILGQKWGKRNGPPYPLKESEHSASEKKAFNSGLSGTEKKGKNAVDAILKDQGRDKVRIEEKINAQKLLGMSDEEYEKAKKIAKITGVSLGTAAGVFFIGAALGSNAGQEMLSKDLNDITPSEFSQVLLTGINNDKTHPEAFDLDDSLFKNDSNGDYVGDRARAAGYRELDSDFIERSISNRALAKERSELDYNNLAEEVCKNIRMPRDPETNKKDRRLSCWSASNAYFLSSLTGKEYASKNFQNAVDFNKFDKLYIKSPNIYDPFGKKVSSYVGTFGKEGNRSKPEMADTLTRSILTNIGKSNNLTPDKSRTVGFINAGHNAFGCPHQWNFEIKYNKTGGKQLFIIDGYDGYRYPVAKMTSIGRIKYDPIGINRFRDNIAGFNDDSIRFYAPSLESVNTDVISKVVIGKS